MVMVRQKTVALYIATVFMNKAQPKIMKAGRRMSFMS